MTDVVVAAEDLLVLLEEFERAPRPKRPAVAAAGRLRSHLTPTLFDRPAQITVPHLVDPAAPGEPGHHGGDTDMAAAYAIRPRAGTQRLRVLEAIFRSGIMGSTDEELEDRLGFRRPSPGNRRGELVAGGWVVDSGRRRNTRSGHPAAVWVLTDAGATRMATWTPDGGDAA